MSTDRFTRGPGQSLASPDFPHPQSPHSRIFSFADEFLGASRPTLRSSTALNTSIINVLVLVPAALIDEKGELFPPAGGRVKSPKGDEARPASQASKNRRAISGDINFSGTVDLFGEPLDRVSPPQLLPAIDCSECGKSFVQPKTNGRPQKFCSPECRAESKHRQIRDWLAAHRSLVRVEFVTCRYCFRVFEVPPRPGRLPHFCSPACKHAALHPPTPSQPSIFEPLFNVNDGKNS